MQKAKSQKIVVIVLCAVVFGVVFYQFSWQARVSTLTQATAVRVATAAKKGDLAAATKAKEQEAGNRELLAAVQALLPPTADAQGVIRQLTQLATASGVNWENVSQSKPVASAVAGLQAAPITISIKGPMENIQAYLLNVRGAAVGRIITVDSVSTASTVDPTTQAVVLTATLTLKAFVYVVDPATIAGAPGAAAATTPTTAKSTG
jgi:Tfp pilus assembly protein PilO